MQVDGGKGDMDATGFGIAGSSRKSRRLRYKSNRRFLLYAAGRDLAVDIGDDDYA